MTDFSESIKAFSNNDEDFLGLRAARRYFSLQDNIQDRLRHFSSCVGHSSQTRCWSANISHISDQQIHHQIPRTQLLMVIRSCDGTSSSLLTKFHPATLPPCCSMAPKYRRRTAYGVRSVRSGCAIRILWDMT
jgi:hypothetical protein